MMSKTTDAEWEVIQEALVKGGLRETIDRILLTREDTPGISEANRLMVAEAFAGNHFVITSIDNYLTVHDDHGLILEGKEVDGTLYVIFHVVGGVEVMVGDQIKAGWGVRHATVAEAWDHIARLTSL